jgi:hypothetical protein
MVKLRFNNKNLIRNIFCKKPPIFKKIINILKNKYIFEHILNLWGGGVIKYGLVFKQ